MSDRRLGWSLGAGLPGALVGTALALAGVALMVWAAVEMRRRDTTINPYGKPAALVTTGPFHFSRNPIYVGDTAAYVGVALVFDAVVPFLLLPLLHLTIHLGVVRGEERALEAAFGDAYRAYRARVRRWL